MKELKIVWFLLAAILLGGNLFHCKNNTQKKGILDKSSVSSALSQILSKGKPGAFGAFVIFGGKSDFDYVQYALDEKGLLLNWPTEQKGGAERLPAFIACLIQKGFHEIKPDLKVSALEQVEKLSNRQFIVLDDGLYAQVGKDVDEIKAITLFLMKTIFKVSNETEINITLELE